VIVVAQIDPALSLRVIGWRELRYSDAPPVGSKIEPPPADWTAAGDDRPPHVRAASGLAFAHGRLAVIQDDAAFIGTVAGDEVAAIMLPRGAGGRRRFEVALGNKADKLDLESCIALGDDLYAFGSGSTPQRERVAHVGYATQLLDASPLYRVMREELRGPVNIEGVAAVGRELWMFHRGNCGGSDLGPAIVRFSRTQLLAWLAGDGPVPDPTNSKRYDLGSVGDVRFGFTDAVGVGNRAFYLASAEDSPNAVDDGVVLASQLGVIEMGVDGYRHARAATLEVDGAPLKAEGLAFDPKNPQHVWVVTDPDDVDQPSRLYELELVGPW
jgi:hypothetical protein